MSRILSDMLVFVPFLVAVNKTTRQSNLKKGRFILAHTHPSRKDVIVGVWGHNAPTFRKCELLPIHGNLESPSQTHSEEHFHDDYKSHQMDAKINHYITSALFSIYHTYEIILK